MKKITFCLSISLLFFASLEGNSVQKNGNLPSPFCVIPQPQNIVLLKERGLNHDDLKGLMMIGEFERPVFGIKLTTLTRTDKSGKGILTLRLDNSTGVPESEEGYILTVSGGSAEIVSKGEAGLFYGCQTLEQLLEDAGQFQVPVPACRITDSPALPYRAVHFDVKHHLDHMNYYYESIDRLARYKINAIIFEFEDKLRYQHQPIIAAPQAISIDEMAALTEYARKRHIEISPLVQGLGHATFILKHEQYAHLRELSWNRWAFCPLNEATYQVLFDLYRDAIKATPGSRFLHVGGDETGNIGLCPRCKPTADKEGIVKLNLYWLRRVCEFAEENGRTPIFWTDMPFKYAGTWNSTKRDDPTRDIAEKEWKEGTPKLDQILQELPKKGIYMHGNYSTAREPGNIIALDWYKSRGLTFMGATSAQTLRTMLFPHDDRDAGMMARGTTAIRSFNQLAAEKGAYGMLCTAWDDTSPHMEMYWRGFIASAEYGWSPEGRSLEEFDNAWLQKEFGTSYDNFYGLYDKLYKGSMFWYKAYFKKGNCFDNTNFLQPLVQLAHWMPPTEGEEKKQIDYFSSLIDLPDLKAPGAWSKNNTVRLKEAEDFLIQYNVTRKALQGLYESSRTNRFQWELYIAMNDLTVTAPTLLLALKQIDTSDRIQQEAGREKVNAALTEFDKAWKNLQFVYGKTRFISNPSGYVPDRYFHNASQKEDLSWMIQSDEIFRQMVREWLADNNQKNIK